MKPSPTTTDNHRVPPLPPRDWVVYLTHAEAYGAEMLDTLIIERIRRERKHREGRIPLRIEDTIPMHPPQPREQKKERNDERGVAIIDFTI